MKEFEHHQQTKLKINKETIAEKELLTKMPQDHIKDQYENVDISKDTSRFAGSKYNVCFIFFIFSRTPATKAQSSLRKIISNITQLEVR